MSCFAGIITGIMSFAHFSSFERFNRSYAAGIMFFISSESGHLWKICKTFILGWIMTDTRLPPSQPSLFYWAWPFIRGWQSTSWGDALGTGASPGPTSWAGSPCLWPFLQVKREKKNTDSEIHTVQAKFKRQAHETFHLLQVFSTYVPTESVNAGEGTARTRWTQPVHLRWAKRHPWLISHRHDVRCC